MARPKGSKSLPKDKTAAKTKPKAKAKVKAETKKGPKAAAAVAGPEVGKSGQARKVITQNNLKNLLTECDQHKGRADSHNGKLREAIANAVQHQNLNKKVFSLIRQLDKLEPETLLVYLEDLEHYLDVSGLNDRADSVGKLPLGNGPVPDDDEAETGDEAEEGPPTKIMPAETVSKPQGTPAASGVKTTEAPGGTVHMLPDRKAAAASN